MLLHSNVRFTDDLVRYEYLVTPFVNQSTELLHAVFEFCFWILGD